ncbi:MAG: acyl-CoA dehydrogenase [Rhodospirillaceae bacterium]|jgi:alkylation response protein AidB-like acyl-CoA dehydrogenase|nr:acyl-CoA dehydrogenase [Rhodospirillaceae bacterium]
MLVFDRLKSQMELPEEEQLVVDSVRQMCRDRISPRAEIYDQSGAFPWDNVKDINELGLNAMFVPDEFGGAHTSFACYLECVKEISAACASTGIIWATNYHAMKPVIDFANDEQKKRWLPNVAEGALASLCITEPSAGSDATGMRTKFTPDGNEIVIDGNKTFITNGDVADYLLLFGKWSEIDDPKRSISVLVVETKEARVETISKENKMGHRASSTATLAFDGVRVPRVNLIHNPGDGLKLLLASLNKSRPSVAAQALGIARAAFDEAVSYINERQQSGRKIIEFQGIQFLLADLATELAMCEAFLNHVARLIDSGAPDFSTEASMVKMRASDLAMRMATEAVQLYGGYGYVKEYKVERLMRDAKITQIWEGTNQVHRQLIGRAFMEK